MKRLVLILLIITFSLSSERSSAAFDYVLLRDVNNGDLLTIFKLKEKDPLTEIILLPAKETYDEKAVKGMIERINNLPLTLLQKIQDNHIHIKFFLGQLTDDPMTSYLKGTTPRGYQNKSTVWNDVPGIGGSSVVLVKIGASEKGSGHGSTNLELHELAHSIDKIVYKGIRDDPFFQSLWKAEVNNLFPSQPYFQLYPEEYFAESFAMFYAGEDSKDILQIKAPKTYQLIQSLK